MTMTMTHSDEVSTDVNLALRTRDPTEKTVKADNDKSLQICRLCGAVLSNDMDVRTQ